MSDPAPTIATAMAAAAQSLRDTAKWLVGGVVATAAGVFTGSSLTAAGALDPTADTFRLLLALGGVVAGFMGLAMILIPAIRVLTRDSRTLREIASAGETDKEIVALLEMIDRRYKTQMPDAAAGSLSTYLQLVETALRRNPRQASDEDLLRRATTDFAIFNADAGFHFVRNRFYNLLGWLGPGTLIAIFGFGLFAWAANPPPAKERPPGWSLIIQGEAKQ